MKNLEIAQQRLKNQRIIDSTFNSPAEVVHWLGAVQAQDFAGAKWSLGLRIPNSNESMIDKAFEEGSILRTHLLRPTWHFVTPADIRWMLALTAPRVHAVNAFMYRKVELDEKIFKKTNAIMEKALQGGKQLTRDELREAFTKAGIKTEGEQRMTYIMMQAELDGLICSGPRKGKQFTYMLLDERVPQVAKVSNQEALAKLATRYLTSRGPVTAHDFAKWSGLTISDAKRGIESVKSQFQNETINDQTYWFTENQKPVKIKMPLLHLLSIFDEYISSYKNRSALGSEEYAKKLSAMGNALTYIVILNSQIIGTWKRTLEKKTVTLQPDIFTPLKKDEKEALRQTSERYGKFLGLETLLEYK
jgi:hypothetical protein